MKRRKKKERAYRTAAQTPGYIPPNAVAWCLHHDRGMNYNYIRRKHCLNRKVCKHLRWLAEERSD